MQLRVTFEPALANDRRPWPTLNALVLASHRPAGTPEESWAPASQRRS